jgi:hypothetical protein
LYHRPGLELVVKPDQIAGLLVAKYLCHFPVDSFVHRVVEHIAIMKYFSRPVLSMSLLQGDVSAVAEYLKVIWQWGVLGLFGEDFDNGFHHHFLTILHIISLNLESHPKVLILAIGLDPDNPVFEGSGDVFGDHLIHNPSES